MSRWHILPLTLVLSLAFTYAGVEESLGKVLQHPDFLANFFLNSLEISAIFYFTYGLYFRKAHSFLQAIWKSLSLFVLIELFRLLIFDYEPEDYVELYSITLPFGTILLVAFNYFYALHARSPQEKAETLPSNKPEDTSQFWIETSGGQVQFLPREILFARLEPNYLTLTTQKGEYKCFISLKKLEELLSHAGPFFRLNKQSLCHLQAVQSFKPLKDGRLEVTVKGGSREIVSKNKASSFKKWIANASP